MLHSPCVIDFSQKGSDVIFPVHVVPRASTSAVAGENEGALKVRVAASPVAGAANRELIRVLAKFLNLKQNAFEIVSGLSSRRKIVRVHGAGAEQLQRLRNTT